MGTAPGLGLAGDNGEIGPVRISPEWDKGVTTAEIAP